MSVPEWPRDIRWLYTRRLRLPNLHGAFASGGKRNAHGPESNGHKDRGDSEDRAQGKALAATGNDREIEVELEVISSNATRMRTVAKQGFFLKDRATATEIILQTEKVLGVS